MCTIRLQFDSKLFFQILKIINTKIPTISNYFFFKFKIRFRHKKWREIGKQSWQIIEKSTKKNRLAKLLLLPPPSLENGTCT